ncbi:DUF6701 domain-containing protein [Idiomarina seosinensis]|uniref:DUF6701 domain-containing protein n=1 Tax=Idiomarina seosinensis TaxID=281739 RepID=UPI0018E59C17|nr:DUF6701 domain-containing protein [Idiomarina seosinensis]
MKDDTELSEVDTVKIEVNGDLKISKEVEFNEEGSPLVNIVVTGKVTIQKDSEVNANIKADDKVDIKKDVEINGNIESGDEIKIDKDVEVNGNINAKKDVKLGKDSEINGYVNAPNYDDLGKGTVSGETCDQNDNEGACSGTGGGSQSNTIGDWHFDEQQWQGNAGEVIDASGNGNDGRALRGATTNVFSSAITGTPGTCRYGTFDGSNQVQIPDIAALSSVDSVSVSLWFKGGSQRQDPNDNDEDYQTLLILGEGPTLGSDGRFEVYRRANGGGLNFEVRNNQGDVYSVEYGDQSENEPQLLNDEWQHLAATFNADEGVLRLYINGTEVATFSTPGNFNLNNIGGQPNLYIGGQQFGSNGLVGEIDEVTVATGVYTQAEVTELYNRTRSCGAAQAPAQCSAIWPTAFDDTGNTEAQPFPLPDNSSQNQLPQLLQPTDYLRIGDFADVGENYDTNGETSRVYIDGDLTIQSGRRINTSGDARELILIVTGDLTIERDARINAYIYVQSNFRYFHSNDLNNRILISGGVSVGGTSTALDSGRTFGPNITYQRPVTPLDGGQFCAAEPPGAPQPLLNWRLNDGPWDNALGQVLDSSGNGFNGTNSNTAWSTDTPAIPTNLSGEGTCGYGEFDYTQNHTIQIADDGSGLNNQLDFGTGEEFTIGLWIKPDSFNPTSSLMTILSKDTNYEFHVKNDGSINWWWNTDAGNTRQFDSSTSITQDVWQYVAIRYKDGEQSITIIDDQFNIDSKTTENYTGGLTTNDLPLILGNDFNQNRYFDGDMDEVSIFDESLTDTQLIAVAQQTSLCQSTPQVCLSPTLNETSFQEDWQIVEGNNSVPGVINSGTPSPRLRLTENIQNQTTAITLKEPVAAAGNRVEVTFRLFAYGGSGADGIALVLSDKIPDNAGQFGGSLGYANANGNEGFDGGWLGIGFDAYGNFANPNEGRNGGVERTPDSVTLRGAEDAVPGRQEYQYIGTSDTLNPGIDDASSTAPEPGHLYKVVVDNTDTSSVSVEVLRDISGQGDNYTSLYQNTDISGLQPAIPDQFYISFAGSTGGSTNVHEFDLFQVCSSEGDGATGVEHYRLEFNSQALTCTGADITVRACEDINCNNISTDSSTVDLSLSDAADDWSENPVNFFGSATVQLQKYTAGTYQVAIDSATPSANNSSRCFVDGAETTDCEITFNDTGFLFTNGPNLTSTDIPKQTAGTSYSNLYLHTVELNNSTLQCQSAIEQVGSIDMRRQCINPNSCISDLSTYPQATMSASSDAGSATLPANGGFVSVPVQFSGGSEALAIDYGDVGEVRLSARATLPNGKVLEGSSESFVWEPAAIGVTSSNPNETFSGDIIARAGREITVNLTALNSNGAVTPNFGNELVTERLELSNTVSVAEADEIAGNISGEENFDDPVNGTTSSNSIVYSEVGEPQFVAEIESGDYLAGVHPPVSTPTRTHSPGRYIPDRFEISTSGFDSTSCEFDEDYFYIGQLQPLDGSTQVSAVNAAGAVTVNYDDGLPYVKTNAELEFYPFNEDSSSTLLPSSSQLEPINTELSWTDGIGTFVGIPEVRYERMVGSPEGPYAEYQLGVQYNDAENGNYYSLIDTSGAELNSNGAPRSYYALNSSGLNLVYGRMQLQNLFGPPSDPLSIKGQAEYWNGTEFVAFEQDVCTAFEGSQVNDNVVTSDYDAELQVQAGAQQLLNDGKLFNDSVPIAEQLAWIEDSSNAVVGIQQFIFELDVPDFLKVDNDNDGDFDDNPEAEATFGIYQGSDRQIYWEEVGW